MSNVFWFSLNNFIKILQNVLLNTATFVEITHMALQEIYGNNSGD